MRMTGALSEPRSTSHEVGSNFAHLPGGQIWIDIQRSDIPPEDLFCFGARENPKRAFLFLSRVLGKHLPSRPQQIEDVCARIAGKIPALPTPVLFIGMAETATGLGHGVFESWRARNPGVSAIYIDSSRYPIKGANTLVFEEAHSHAPKLILSLPGDAQREAAILRARSLVLIDDEISTGNTFVNLAQACRTVAPGLAHVHLASITDFMGAARRQHLGPRFNLPFTLGSLLTGAWTFMTHSAYTPAAIAGPSPRLPSLDDNGYGRLGCLGPIELNPDDVGAIATDLRPDARVLVLGTGEFMHAPTLLARHLERVHELTTWVQASTRSPIASWGPIVHALQFHDNYGEGIQNFLYNIDPHNYDHVLLCYEDGAGEGIHGIAKRLGARAICFSRGGRLAYTDSH